MPKSVPILDAVQQLEVELESFGRRPVEFHEKIEIDPDSDDVLAELCQGSRGYYCLGTKKKKRNH